MSSEDIVNDRDCENCIHYKQWSPDYGLENIWSCEKWECNFEPKNEYYNYNGGNDK